ncbi:MAG: Glutamyl-tRNA(Gln) amidotransferase subunit A [Candidatus Shapirobacteria bacterium GW2011_GWE2_38_30]|uniref:Glutamyl-tRNA(Gln) amidotransferase subunit A n=1 Tax=Candidatus Shapirobacteria bacterium GW2011_GWE2_38_30 TaxID=1618490 RepID=A0A0G0JSA2_9BACT|nr:MAG: Glutamyl-tRNA(Gln) amidotransferase subunit A [Candidatus Shapirobacteria bacterium GW2011_GWE2_38_30]
MSDLNKLTLTQALSDLRSKKISPKELVADCFARIESVDKKLNAFLTLNKKQALEMAKTVDISLKI